LRLAAPQKRPPHFPPTTDVHISKMPLAEADDKDFDAFEKALAYDSTKSVENSKTP
jgi:hypothetical protein